MENLHEKIFKEKGINETQFHFLDAIHKKKIVSLYFELRMLLYLGIMLFTGGLGYIVYQNLGDIGHIAVMLLLALSIGLGGFYIKLKSKPYAHNEVVVEHFYFDYLVVLVSLLIISLFTYFQVYFDLVALLIKWTSLVTGVVFLTMAYRYDNKMVLSMGIVALAAVVGLTLSPINWVTGDMLKGVNIYLLSIVYGVILIITGQVLSIKNIKKHFAFTYHNFALLLIYFGGLSLIFDSGKEVLMALLLLVFAGLIGWYTWRFKMFLFFLYSCLAGYIAFTYLFFSTGVGEEIWFMYFPISCIGGVVLLVKQRKHFSND
jgi:hypothetical protein